MRKIAIVRGSLLIEMDPVIAQAVAKMKLRERRDELRTLRKQVIQQDRKVFEELLAQLMKIPKRRGPGTLGDISLEFRLWNDVTSVVAHSEDELVDERVQTRFQLDGANAQLIDSTATPRIMIIQPSVRTMIVQRIAGGIWVCRRNNLAPGYGNQSAKPRTARAAGSSYSIRDY